MHVAGEEANRKQTAIASHRRKRSKSTKASTRQRRKSRAALLVEAQRAKLTSPSATPPDGATPDFPTPAGTTAGEGSGGETGETEGETGETNEGELCLEEGLETPQLSVHIEQEKTKPIRSKIVSRGRSTHSLLVDHLDEEGLLEGEMLTAPDQTDGELPALSPPLGRSPLAQGACNSSSDSQASPRVSGGSLKSLRSEQGGATRSSETMAEETSEGSINGRTTTFNIARLKRRHQMSATPSPQNSSVSRGSGPSGIRSLLLRSLTPPPNCQAMNYEIAPRKTVVPDLNSELAKELARYSGSSVSGSPPTRTHSFPGGLSTGLPQPASPVLRQNPLKARQNRSNMHILPKDRKRALS
jgi:hypothetical protein